MTMKVYLSMTAKQFIPEMSFSDIQNLGIKDLSLLEVLNTAWSEFLIIQDDSQNDVGFVWLKKDLDNQIGNVALLYVSPGYRRKGYALELINVAARRVFGD
jgi:N-acetylglutamate synthase-like GNAT family acetyltransferase